MIKLGTARRFTAILANVSLLFNSFVPFLLAIQPVYAQEAPAVEEVVVESTPAPEVPIIEVTPTLELLPEITPEVNPEVTPEITQTPETTPEVTPEITPTSELTPTDVPVTTEVGTLTPSIETITPTPEATTTPTTEVNQNNSEPSPTETARAPPEETTPTPTEIPVLGTSTSTTGQIETTIVPNNTCRTDLLNPQIFSDKPDYSPTEIAIITGSNFIPNIQYSLVVTSNNLESTYTINTDSEGNFTYSYQLDGTYRPDYKVEIKNIIGTVIASTTFTDSNPATIISADFPATIFNDPPLPYDFNIKIDNLGGTVHSAAKYHLLIENIASLSDIKVFNYIDGGTTVDLKPSLTFFTHTDPDFAEIIFNPVASGGLIPANSITTEKFQISFNNPITSLPKTHKIHFGLMVDGMASVYATFNGFLTVNPTPTATPTPADTWPSCKYNCTAQDIDSIKFELVGDSLGTPLSCTSGNNTQVYLKVTYDNHASARYGAYILGDIWEGGTFNQSIVPQTACLDTMTNGLNSDIFDTGFNWTCGDSIEIKNLTIAWDTNSNTCSNFFSNTKCYPPAQSFCGGSTGYIVITPPIANFSTDEVCLGNPTTFTDLTTGGQTPYSYSWNFGDSTTSTSNPPTTHTYLSAGNYNASLTVTDSNSPAKTNTISKQVTVKQCTSNILFTKNVVGGSALPSAWSFAVYDNVGGLVGDTFTSGNSYPFNLGNYTVQESTIPHYSLTNATGVCSINPTNGNIDLIVDTTGGNCNLTNTYVPYCGDNHVDTNEQCDDGNTNDLDACSNTCTFTKGHLIVQKTTIPAGDPASFFITASGTGTIDTSQQTISDTVDKDYEVTPGTYSITETVPTGWSKTGDTCQNVVVGAGETEYCTFTNIKKGTISGMKYEDFDGDISTPGQSGVGDWTIQLWKDDVLKSSTTTSSGSDYGFYSFTDLEPGNYVVKEVMGNGWYPLSPESKSIDVTLDPGENDTNNNFVNVQYATVTVYKEVDTDGDGDVDITNSSDWTWNIGDINNLQTGTTAPNILAGYHTISENQKSDYHVTSFKCNNGQIYWNDYGAVESQSVEVVSGQNLECVFTNARDTGGLKVQKVIDDGTSLTQWSFSLDGGVAIQANAQGIVDFGQINTGFHYITESGPSGYTLYSIGGACTENSTVDGQGDVTVEKDENKTCIFSNSINKGSLTIIKNAIPDDPQDFAFTTTGSGLSNFSLDDDADATLSNTKVFSNLFPGTYSVSESDITSWDKTSATCDDGSPINAIVITPGENITCTFTNTKLGSIQGKKFEDKNANGAWNSGDTYLNNWTITLYRQKDGWQYDSEKITGHTGILGQYRFNNLYPGEYLVCENIKTGWDQTYPISGQLYNGSVCHSINLTAGQNKTEVLFGNFELGKVQGKKYNDVDGDGNSYETDEEYLNDWKIRLYKNWEEPMEITTSNTGVLGQYQYTNLLPGTYQICEVLKEKWAQTWPKIGDVPVEDNGTPHPTYGVAVANQSEEEDEGSVCWQTVIDSSGDFNQLLKFGNVKLNNIHGYKWDDKNGNAIEDDDESRLSDWEIFIDKNDDSIWNEGEQKTITSSNPDPDHFGWYWFENLFSGTYKICEVPQSDWLQTYPTPICHTISLPYSNQELERSVLNYIEEPAPAYNFGNQQLSSVTVTKFNDRNGNKTKDEGEETLLGWDITLTNQVSKATDQNGQALFDKLTPSTYYLDENLKEGWNQTTIYCDDQNQETTLTPTPGERQEVFNRIFSVKTVNAQTAPTGYEINLSAGQDLQCYIGNRYTEPKLTISKTNNRWPAAQTNGSEVEYTITLNVQENNIKGVSVIDLPPYGFKYKAGTWKVLVNGNPINIPEPVYFSPGKWQIGDLNKDDVITLKYIATIDNSVDPGIYKDAAWAYGCQDSQECTIDSSDKLLASAIAPGYLASTFVGTQIKIDPVFASQDVNIVKEEGQVLGATTEMPGTGAQTIWMIIFGILSLVGLAFIIYGLKREKNIMKSLIIITLISLASLFSVKTVKAIQSSNIFISVENPISPTNKDKFTLSFTALDIQNRPLTVKCFKVNPDSSETQIGTVDIKAGGNSGECNLDNNSLNESGKTYYFYAIASAEGDSYRSDSVAVDYNNSGPGTPNDYSKEKEGTCNYKISFKASNDGKTNIIRIYRADVTKFIADSGSQIGQVGISPDQKGSFTDVNVPDCNKTYYYVIRAFDEAGNGSGLAGDSITVFISTTTPTTTTGSVLGAIPIIGDNNIPKEEIKEATSGENQEGSILGTEIPTNPKSISAQFQSFISRHKISSALIALLVLVIIGYVVKRIGKKKR